MAITGRVHPDNELPLLHSTWQHTSLDIDTSLQHCEALFYFIPVILAPWLLITQAKPFWIAEQGCRWPLDVDLHPDMFYCGSAKRSILILLDSYRNIYTERTFIALWANHLKGWYVFWNWPLWGLQGVEVCAGLLQSVCRVTGCCSSRLSQKIFYWEKKYFMWNSIKNKNCMENWQFWGLNWGTLKQIMMYMLVLTSFSSAWTLCYLLHISSLIIICNFYSFWATEMVLISKWGRILQEMQCQCQLWLICRFAGRKPAKFHKRNILLGVNTTDFEKHAIQAHSALRSSGKGSGKGRLRKVTERSLIY